MRKRLARDDRGKGRQAQAGKRRKNAIAAAIVGVASIAVLVVIYLSMSGAEPRRTKDGLVATGEPAPAFSLPRLGGAGSLSPADFKGKVLVLNFWHSQ